LSLLADIDKAPSILWHEKRLREICEAIAVELVYTVRAALSASFSGDEQENIFLV
jgi:hypothetical protein